MANVIKTLNNKTGDVILPRTVSTAVTLTDGSLLDDSLIRLTDGTPVDPLPLNADTLNGLESTDFALVEHDHAIEDVTGLQTVLNGKADDSIILSGALYAADWVGSSAPYEITIQVAPVTATSVQEILPALAVTASDLEKLQAANIVDGGQGAGFIVLKAFGDKPDTDIPIRIIVRGDL